MRFVTYTLIQNHVIQVPQFPSPVKSGKSRLKVNVVEKLMKREISNPMAEWAKFCVKTVHFLTPH